VDTRHGYVHVRSYGEGGVPLVLLHYSPGSGLAFESVLPLLGADRLVLAPDRLGFGMSDAAREGVDMPTYAEATMDVVDHFGIGQFDLVGTHTGTVESLQIVTVHGERVRKLVLVAIPLFDEEVNALLRTKGADALEGRPKEDGSHLLANWKQMVDLSEGRYFQDKPQMAWVNPDAPGAERFKWSPEVRHQFFVWRELGSVDLAYRAIFKFPIAETLPGIRQPLLVLNDATDLWRVTAAARPLLPPQAVYEELPDADMLAFELRPDEMADRIRNFLDGETSE
jgi:pimeloyl-ACP methyl ester carboxylesterase